MMAGTGDAGRTDRRSFLGRAARTMAAVPLGLAGMAQTRRRPPRELAAIGRSRDWINTAPLPAADLLGRVVVVGFWTYTCINWLRTLPYLRAWTRHYGQALTFIGVHTPEFPFERDLDNVRRAVRQMRIDYPVVLDNDYAIWRAFRNSYWPALYFIDPRGRSRDPQFGEGEYPRAELTIRQLLMDAGIAAVSRDRAPLEAAAGVEAAADWDSLRSPERYLGYERTESFASRGSLARDSRRAYSVPSRLALNEWALGGDWTVGAQAVTLQTSSGRLVNRFHARDVHLVAGAPRSGQPARFRVTIDGQPPGPARGLDVDADGQGILAEQRLYQLIRQPRPIADRTLQIEFAEPGAEVYAFTFG